MNSTTAPSMSTNATRQKPSADLERRRAAPRVPRARRRRRRRDRRRAARGAAGPSTVRVGLEAQVLDVERVGARVCHPHARGVDEHLAVVPLVRDDADVVEACALDPVHRSSAPLACVDLTGRWSTPSSARVRGSPHALRGEDRSDHGRRRRNRHRARAPLRRGGRARALHRHRPGARPRRRRRRGERGRGRDRRRDRRSRRRARAGRPRGRARQQHALGDRRQPRHDRRGDLAARHGRHAHERVPVLARGAAGDDRAPWRRDRQRRLGQRPRLLRQRGLQRRQGRPRQPHDVGRRALRALRRPGQRRRPRLDPDCRLGRAGGARARPARPASGAGSRSGASAHRTRWPRACSSWRPTRPRS